MEVREAKSLVKGAALTLPNHMATKIRLPEYIAKFITAKIGMNHPTRKRDHIMPRYGLKPN